MPHWEWIPWQAQVEPPNSNPSLRIRGNRVGTREARDDAMKEMVSTRDPILFLRHSACTGNNMALKIFELDLVRVLPNIPFITNESTI